MFEGKCMGIIVYFYMDFKNYNLDLISGEIWFYQKGVDIVMGSIVVVNDWLDEEMVNMVCEGFCILVVGCKKFFYQ